MSTVIPAPAVAALNVQGSDQVFPVRRIYCVGRNYVEHAQEMGFTGREDPFFFCKPADSILNVLPGQVCDMPYPSRTQDLHHEIELVVALSQGGRDLTVEQAAECVWGYAVGLDMTRRDLQTQAKKAGRPWEVGKAFDHSAPTGALVPRSRIGELSQGAISLDVNGERRQTGDLNQLIWNVAESIAYLSTLFELQAGDIIFTGTPAGVGSVERGDVMHGAIDGLGSIDVRLV